jgi:hypothetical protein
MAEVFAYIAVRECGCVCHAAAPSAVPDSLKEKFFRQEWEAGKVRIVETREEWLSLPWRCPTCEPIMQAIIGKQEKKRAKR